ncbi:MAG TPA: DNA translocase FtsK [Patescibacteria group bacterium]|nr:DNA translocase FtsK [Patescibacteria group bacterium]
MARRRGSRKKFKLKLRKNTVYTLFALGFFLVAGLCFLSFSKSGSALTLINTILASKFGGVAFFFPFVLLFFGFLFLHLRMYLSKVNVSVGYLLFFICLLALSKSGEIGLAMFQIVEDILSKAGADIVYVVGLFVGIIVFFDTSIDELAQVFSTILKNSYRIFPIGLFKGGQSKNMGGLQHGKPMTIKGGAKVMPVSAIEQDTAEKHPNIQINKKNPEILSDMLVSNALAGNGVWEYPPLSLLSDDPGKKADRGDIKQIASVIEKTLQSFGVEARVAEVNLGPAVTQYALEIALGTKVSKITSLANDLALATEAPTGQIRIEAPIPGRNLVGIEIPNRSLEVVTLKTMLASTVMQKSKSKLAVSLGLAVSGAPVIADINKMPHVLIAGTTGSGKSIMINSMITSLLFRASPQEIKLILVDPKRVELTGYNGIPHLLTPVIVEVDKILSALRWATGEMDRRYKLFAERGVRNIDAYNELSGFQAIPYIVIIIDELADLMMYAPVEVEDSIARLAQMSRAVGIHLVIATQRPSVNIITGLIKANIPCRIAFNVSSMIDSRVILDTPGAEKLLGRGDMLFIPPDQAKPTRIQGAFVSDKEVKKLVEFLKSKNVAVEYTEEILNQPILSKKNGNITASGHDADFDQAVRIICQFKQASSSFLQRKMSIGYAKAARLIDQLEEAGVVGPAEGAKPRDVLVHDAEEFLQSQNPQ